MTPKVNFLGKLYMKILRKGNPIGGIDELWEGEVWMQGGARGGRDGCKEGRKQVWKKKRMVAE